MSSYLSHHVLGDLVRRKVFGLGQQPGPSLAESFAIVGVVIPIAAGGFVAFHQYSVAAAHFAVEILHAQLLPSLGMFGEILRRAEKVPVRKNL